MRRSFVLVAAVIALAPVALPAADAGLLGIVTPGTLLVGYHAGALGDLTTLVGTLGGTVTGGAPEISLLRVAFPNLATARSVLALSPLVDLVESEGTASLAGAEWNGAEWNGADWNGADWNSASNATQDAGVLQWGLLATDTPAAWRISTGARAAPICVVDSGIAYDHPDLSSNMWSGPDGAHGVNFVTPGSSPYDDAGHGTHVAGIAAATVGNAVGGAGVANEPLMAVKVLDSTGHGKESDVAFGLVWCATHGAKVALLALSADETSTMKRALAYADAHDVLIVASAGNGACSGCVAFPANDPHVLAVSAVGSTLAIAPFSSRGSQVALAAPGVDITSTFTGAGYRSGSGTSQAAAFVAGAAALVRDAGGLSASQARAALTSSAVDLGLPGRDATYGAGLLDTRAALVAAQG